MPESRETTSDRRGRGLALLIGVWLVLAAVVVLFAKQNFTAPGLYYDEAVFAGLAKDFLTGQVHGQHMPDHYNVTLGGRPFPFFVQTYLGALKSWMLIPPFRFFGSTTAVLRGSNVFWALIGLLFLMLAARRWLGPGAAILTGVLLASDPTFFFISVLDWGVAIPSFVCRSACLYFAICWSLRRKFWDAFLVGLFAGLGLFNKADFAIFLIGAGLAAAICYWKELLDRVRQEPSAIVFAAFGFALSGGPMLLKVPRMLALTLSAQHPNATTEFGVKLQTLLSMYDGSHFYRLMNAGGVFERMYDGASGPKHLLGVVLIIGCLAFAGIASAKKVQQPRAISFLIIGAILTTLGVFALPYAVRIHHAVLVYPLPHLIVAAVMVALWKTRFTGKKFDTILPAVIAIVLVDLSARGIHGIAKTEQLIGETGGRGRWSESLDQFCREVRTRSDLRIISLDWGFNEQLLFLTDGPQLAEPFWGFTQTLPSLSRDPSYIYLAHPSEYSVFQADVAYLDQLKKGDENVEITPHLDRQNEVAFYTIRFRP